MRLEGRTVGRGETRESPTPEGTGVPEPGTTCDLQTSESRGRVRRGSVGTGTQGLGGLWATEGRPRVGPTGVDFWVWILVHTTKEQYVRGPSLFPPLRVTAKDIVYGGIK